MLRTSVAVGAFLRRSTVAYCTPTSVSIFKCIRNYHVSDADTFGDLQDTPIIEDGFKKNKGRNSRESEVFGTASTKEIEAFIREGSEELLCEDDKKDGPDHHIRLSEIRGPHRPAHFGRRIERLAKKGKIAEAIHILEHEMLVEKRVMPNSYVFTTLIGGLGRVGYTEKAFKLFNMMKKMGLPPEKPTYTALFNACANSPYKEDGLNRAYKLWMQIKEKDVEINNTIYKSIIKAFGKCGDVQMAFRVADQMIKDDHRQDLEVFNHLLIACNSDKEIGLKLAIEVWRRMRKRSIIPNLQSYNLLLRTIRDCKLGEPYFANQLLKTSRKPAIEIFKSQNATGVKMPSTDKKPFMLQIHPEIKSELSNSDMSKPIFEINIKEESKSSVSSKDNAEGSNTNEHALAINDKKWWDISTTQTYTIWNTLKDTNDVSSYDASVMDVDMPNLLNPRSRNLNKTISLTNLDAPCRLLLLGGLSGLISHMKKDQVSFDIKTLVMLAGILPATASSDSDLTSLLHHFKLTANVEFYNAIMKRKVQQTDLEGAKDILHHMVNKKICPTILTFGVLAQGVHHMEDSKYLLKSMEEIGIPPTPDIMGILLRRTHNDFSYILFLCKKMQELNIKPNKEMLKFLEFCIANAKLAVVSMEHGEEVKKDYLRYPDFKEEFGYFMKIYSKWLKKTEVEPVKNPWASFEKSPAN